MKTDFNIKVDKDFVLLSIIRQIHSETGVRMAPAEHPKASVLRGMTWAGIVPQPDEKSWRICKAPKEVQNNDGQQA